MATPSNPPNTAQGYAFVGANLTYVTVAASQTNAALGPAGKKGDYINHILVVPATTGAGTISISDGGGSAINLFVSGTLPSTASFSIPLALTSQVGAWTVTTGASVSIIVVGRFS